jgi:arylsulfatase A
VEFSDFLPTLAEAGKAKVPTDRIIDGQSFYPQLLGKIGNPRENIIVHYDIDPDDKPKFRRVRFAFDGKYKLYMDGRMFEVAEDWLEQSPLALEQSSNEAKKARKRLQEALDDQPEWDPDNSMFGGKPSKAFQNFLELQAELSIKVQ